MYAVNFYVERKGSSSGIIKNDTISGVALKRDFIVFINF